MLWGRVVQLGLETTALIWRKGAFQNGEGRKEAEDI